MNNIIEKLSSYNLFNYLLPGVVFAYLGTASVGINFVEEDLLRAVFLYYFYGLVISRIGSTLFEPLFRKFRFIKFESYPNYLAACKKDPKIELLLEASNMYRTFIALFSMIVLLKAYLFLSNCLEISHETQILFGLILLIVLFSFAYRKQTRFISNRIKNSSLNSKND